jgi:hypothetical protein
MALLECYNWSTSADAMKRIEMAIIQYALRDVFLETTNETKRIQRKEFAQKILLAPTEHVGYFAKAISIVPTIKTEIDANPLTPTITDANLRAALDTIWNHYCFITGG